MAKASAEPTIAELLLELGAAEAAIAAFGPTPEQVTLGSLYGFRIRAVVQLTFMLILHFL